MVNRPAGFTALEFVVISALRAAQLMRGCRPRVESAHKCIMTAQLEVAAGKVLPVPILVAPARPVPRVRRAT
jgi:DNA-directed RNA polymerase subunit K/omega